MNDATALNASRRAKKDEFYTQRVDIENELRHYKRHFKDKIVLCNCDDPRQSEFFKYFVENFEKLGLKRLVATCYKSQDVDLFSQRNCEKAICQIYEGDKNGNMVLDDDEVGVRELQGDGDFRSAECIEILKDADIVVTNPPFSLFREYVAQLVKYGKKFLIIGNVNAITYKEIFPAIRRNELWLGASIHSGDRKFGVPKDYPLNATACGIDENGQRFIRVKGVRWFTNLDYPQRHEKLPLYKKYSPLEFPKYDNYDAIEISKTSDIPYDYDGVMGVPITFMDKYNPEQFEIVGCSDNGAVDEEYKLPHFKRHNEPYLSGKKVYKRIFVRRRAR
ncbi:MAG: adenine-specific methyltransferase EcoRI family protein [Kiritimatiellae bacterium]|nr:adenine-specific methyltransferase EcoRI family protein [Kiritimatiellia bacterium]